MMTYQIPYSSTERVAVRTRNETVEDIQDSGADASLTTPDDEETVPGGTEGEMNSEEPETAQPEVGAETPQEEGDQTENDRGEDGEKVQEQSPAAPQNLPKPTSPHRRRAKIIRSLCLERVTCLRKLDSLEKRQQQGKKVRFYFQKPRW